MWERLRAGKLAKTFAAMMVLLGFSAEADIPIDAENKGLNLTADQKAKLEAHFGKDYAKKMMEGIDSEIKSFMENNMDIKAIQDELDAIVAEKAAVAEELSDAKENNAPAEDISAKVKALNAALTKETGKREELQALVDKLMDEGVGDKPDAIINNSKNMKIVHSATHLFAENKDWNKFEGRSWNARLRDNSVKATDFNSDGNITLLQDDIAHFVRENPKALESLFNDILDLPKEWDRRTGVLDRVADGFIIPGEIVQGRSKGWKPKNNVKIVAEEGRVFRKKIDISFNGYELQEIENTWIRSYNGNDGSHPWKMTFIWALMTEIVKQQMLDDRKAQINGIYAETPEGDGNSGAAVNSQDGLRFLFWYHREVTKKYRATNLGPITDTNIVDKVRQLIMSIPETDRHAEGLELGLSQAQLDRYRIKAGLLYQLHKTPNEGATLYEKDYPIDFPNIIFQPLRDMQNTDFMYITASKNIQILDYNTSEKGKFTVTQTRRDTDIFADYRLGIRLKFVGTKLAQGEPADFEKQKVWTNEAPIFNKDQFVPLFDDETGLIKFHYATMMVDKAWVTDITDIDNAPKGSIIRIIGNTALAGTPKVKDNATFDLAGNQDFNLKSGGTLTLLVNADGTCKELKRTAAPEETISPNEVNFTGTSIDASTGSVFNFVDTADRTLANIINGVEGTTIRIYGTDTTDVDLTIEDVATKIEMSSSAVLSDSASYVDLTLIDGVWYDVKRSITP